MTAGTDGTRLRELGEEILAEHRRFLEECLEWTSVPSALGDLEILNTPGAGDDGIVRFMEEMLLLQTSLMEGFFPGDLLIAAPAAADTERPGRGSTSGTGARAAPVHRRADPAVEHRPSSSPVSQELSQDYPDSAVSGGSSPEMDSAPRSHATIDRHPASPTTAWQADIRPWLESVHATKHSIAAVEVSADPARAGASVREMHRTTPIVETHRVVSPDISPAAALKRPVSAFRSLTDLAAAPALMADIAEELSANWSGIETEQLLAAEVAAQPELPDHRLLSRPKSSLPSAIAAMSSQSSTTGVDGPSPSQEANTLYAMAPVNSAPRVRLQPSEAAAPERVAAMAPPEASGLRAAGEPAPAVQSGINDSTPRPAAAPAVNIDAVVQALSKEIRRAYRRFYGD